MSYFFFFFLCLFTSLFLFVSFFVIKAVLVNHSFCSVFCTLFLSCVIYYVVSTHTLDTHTLKYFFTVLKSRSSYYSTVCIQSLLLKLQDTACCMACTCHVNITHFYSTINTPCISSDRYVMMAWLSVMSILHHPYTLHCSFKINMTDCHGMTVCHVNTKPCV